MSDFQVGDTVQTHHIENRRELFFAPPNEDMNGQFGIINRIIVDPLMPIVVKIGWLEWAYSPLELVLINRPGPLPFD